MPNPAVVFLSRGAQLTRLLQYVVAYVTAEIEKERDDATDPKLLDSMPLREFLDGLKPALERTRAKVSDVQLLLQILFCRSADNFQILIEDLVRSILGARPDLLKEGASGTLEERVEDRATKIGFKSLEDQAEIVKRDFGFALFGDEADSRLVRRIFALRNLITHQYGIVTKRFLARYPEPTLTVGSPYPVSPEEIAKNTAELNRIGTDMMIRCSREYSIRFPDAR